MKLHIDIKMLEVVLDTNIIGINLITSDKVYYKTDDYSDWEPTEIEIEFGGREKGINIYELMYKCKEWAYDNGHKIKSYKEGRSIYEADISEVMLTEGQEHWYMTGDSEPDVVFRSCFLLMKKMIKDR